MKIKKKKRIEKDQPEEVAMHILLKYAEMRKRRE
jgi:hypothetical protein